VPLATRQSVYTDFPKNPSFCFSIFEFSIHSQRPTQADVGFSRLQRAEVKMGRKKVFAILVQKTVTQKKLTSAG